MKVESNDGVGGGGIHHAAAIYCSGGGRNSDTRDGELLVGVGRGQEVKSPAAHRLVAKDSRQCSHPAASGESPRCHSLTRSFQSLARLWGKCKHCEMPLNFNTISTIIALTLFFCDPNGKCLFFCLSQ